MDNKSIVVLAERGEHLLVKIERKLEPKGRTVRFEIWTNKEKFNQGIHSEYVDGKQKIYCSGFAGVDESFILDHFHRTVL